mmetsp:Transcript_10157/g.10122  ORF Transcript_10157/g.10122 Transcript_10157/m.10122 type:complete len:122 (+) Transcript_10157:1094-1459(+)
MNYDFEFEPQQPQQKIDPNKKRINKYDEKFQNQLMKLQDQSYNGSQQSFRKLSYQAPPSVNNEDFTSRDFVQNLLNLTRRPKRSESVDFSQVPSLWGEKSHTSGSVRDVREHSLSYLFNTP